MEVTYKRHPKYTNYFFGTDGSCYSTSSGKFLKPTKDNNGYYRLTLWQAGKLEGGKGTKKVHRLVAETFLGFSDLTINHKNKNRTDNSIENLEYCTHTENIRHCRLNTKRWVYKVSGRNFYAVNITHPTGNLRAGKTFKTEEEAYKVARELYYKHFGVYPW